MNQKQKSWMVILAAVLLIAGGIFFVFRFSQPKAAHFNAARAMQDAAAQLAFGPRIPESEAHRQTVTYIQDQLQNAGWAVEIQQAEVMGHPIQNIIARRGTGSPWYILGSHYDSRMLADHDPDPANHTQPVPGANDGAATTAILLELGRILPTDLEKQVWLVFFDAEDQGSIPGWDWILGSRYFAENLEGQPEGVIVVDMVGDADLQIYYEKNSTQTLTHSLWETAAQAGFPQFISSAKFNMLDDHIPFLQRGLPAIDLIDFDYPYWHTTQDTLDKLSEESLYAVGETLRLWLTKP